MRAATIGIVIAYLIIQIFGGASDHDQRFWWSVGVLAAAVLLFILTVVVGGRQRGGARRAREAMLLSHPENVVAMVSLPRISRPASPGLNVDVLRSGEIPVLLMVASPEGLSLRLPDESSADATTVAWEQIRTIRPHDLGGLPLLPAIEISTDPGSGIGDFRVVVFSPGGYRYLGGRSLDRLIDRMAAVAGRKLAPIRRS